MEAERCKRLKGGDASPKRKHKGKHKKEKKSKKEVRPAGGERCPRAGLLLTPARAEQGEE